MQSKPSIIGFFLIHGFLGSPREWEGLEKLLQNAGYKVHAMTQIGHGDKPDRKLSEMDSLTLLAHCQQEYKSFASQCDKIYIVGHSLGGASALWLAGQRVEKLAGVIAFSTPYEHVYGINYVHGLLQFEAKNLFSALRYAPESLTGFRRPTLMPWWLPLLQKQTTELLFHLREALRNIEVPVWLGHSPYDMIIPYGEMHKIFRSINMPHQVRLHTLAECGHQVFVQSRVYQSPYRLVLSFLANMETGSSIELESDDMHQCAYG